MYCGTVVSRVGIIPAKTIVQKGIQVGLFLPYQAVLGQVIMYQQIHHGANTGSGC